MKNLKDKKCFWDVETKFGRNFWQKFLILQQKKIIKINIQWALLASTFTSVFETSLNLFLTLTPWRFERILRGGKRFTKNVTLDELINCVLFLSFPFSFCKVDLIRQLMKIFYFFSKRIWVDKFFFNIYSYCWITSRVWGRYGSNIRTYTVLSSKHQNIIEFSSPFLGSRVQYDQ